MKRVRFCFGMVLFFWLSMPLSMSHHSFDAVYDGRRTVSVEGVVREFRFMNPHATMTLDAEDPAGDPVMWTVEFDGSINLTVAHWTPETIAPGERVVVYGNPTHTGSPRMFFRRLVRSDGTELKRPMDASADLIDERRRNSR